MPTRRIDDLDKKWPEPCRSPEHYPPTMVAWEPGTYEHECPKCHNIIIFVVPPRPSLILEQEVDALARGQK